MDARDGRAVAATADVDPTYRIGDQLYVQPDARLEECFGVNEPIRMTRLVLEDDVWFTRGAAAALDRGWRAALRRCRSQGGPRLLYLSYADAGGTAERADVCGALFRTIPGLWFLSGYVLSREGAAALLRAMPVVGPVDTWINYRFEELGALALSSPAILQRQDSPSDNSYSVLPYLARAGIVDSSLSAMPTRARAGLVLAWTARGDGEGLAMALSMLGLRVRAFDGDETEVRAQDLPSLFELFDALVDPPLSPGALSAAVAVTGFKFVFETNAAIRSEIDWERLPSSRTAAER